MANAYQEMVQSNWNRAVPMSALFELTFVCNHACSFCYNCPTGQREMSTAEVVDALRKLAEFNILYLTLTCGPGSLQRVLEAARHLHARGVKVTLKCAITRDNQEEVLDMYRLAEDVGVTIIFDP